MLTLTLTLTLTLKYHAEPVSVGDDLALQRLISLGARGTYRRLAQLENEHRLAMVALDLRDPVIAQLTAADPSPEVYEQLRARRKELARIEGHEIAESPRHGRALGRSARRSV